MSRGSVAFLAWTTIRSRKHVKVGVIYLWDAEILLKGRSLTFHEGNEHLKHTSIK